MAALALITAPADEGPINLARFKQQSRIDATDDDAYLTALLKAAIGYLDGKAGILGRALMTQTWELTLDDWPTGGTIQLPLPPLQSVTSVKYLDADGTQQTWASSNYQVDAVSTPGRIVPAVNVSWPTLRGQGQINQVVVRFVAGYGSQPASVPEAIRHAISILAAHWYERRTPVEMGGALSSVPMTVDALIAPYRVVSFGGALNA